MSVLGWREWVTLPEFDIPPIKAKVDSGARTSALHALRIRPFDKDGVPHVEFYVQPAQGDPAPEIRCEAPYLDQRMVKSSNGESQLRYVIETRAMIGGAVLPMEVTLTNRVELGFRMLVGREAIRGRYLINPGTSYRAGKKPSD